MLPPRPHGVNEPHVCLKDDLFERYVRHARIQGVSRRSTETKIGMFLREQLGAKLKDTRPHCRRPASFAATSCRRSKDCRKLFAESLGQPVDWGSEGWESEEWQQAVSPLS